MKFCERDTNEIVADLRLEVRVKRDIRLKARKMVSELLKPTYFNDIPFRELADKLEDEFGLIVIAEDGTRWSGFFCGEDGECFFQLGYEQKVVNNFGLKMTWHKMREGRIEVIGYIS